MAVEGRVQPAQQFFRPGRIGADDDPVRFHEVGDRGAFLEKFGIGGNFEFERAAALGECSGDARTHLLGGAHRNRGFGDHQRLPVEMLPDQRGGA